MIVHPIGNRSLLLAAILPQIFGIKTNPTNPSTWIFTLGIYILLIMCVIVLWRNKKLDGPANDIYVKKTTYE
jgi:hypothetical protein